MELKEGMYVRTKLNDFCNLVAIRKIIEIDYEDDNKFWVDDYIIDTFGDEQNKLSEEDVDKASDDIINLIERDDLLEIRYLIKSNEYQKEVVQVIKNYAGKLYINSFPRMAFIEDFDKYGIEILSIVTKEQFESVKYEVE